VSAPGHLAILAGLVAVLLFAGLGEVALTDRDEGANAGAAREMLEQRSWITPTLIYAPRFAKPAFVYWLMAAGYATLGASEVPARLPSAVATALLVGLTYTFARWALDRATAFRAALILLLAIEPVTLARMALTDAVLVLWTTAAGFAFFRACHGAAPTGRWYVAMYVALALGLLTKGPVGLVVPVAGIALYLALAGGFRRVFDEGRLGWGLVIMLLIAGPWYAAMFGEHGGAYLARARGETLGRVFRTVTGPGGTALFYVPVVLVGFFPWSAFLPAALVGALRGARARARGERAGAVAVFAAAWTLAVLVFFSLVQSRLPHYVAPLFPAAALLVAGAWPARVPTLARALVAALGTLIGAALLAAWTLGPLVARLLAPAYPAAPAATLPVSVAVVGVLALAIGATAALRDGRRTFVALAVLTGAMLALGFHVALPAFNADFVAPPGQLVQRHVPDMRPCDDLVVFGPYRPSLVFYARRPVIFVDAPDRARLAEIAARPRRLFLLTPRAMLDRLPPSLAALPPLDAGGGYLILASPPTSGPCASAGR
jgi:4-amino-4-deoxy-L-arabinose transferase-like glycosyltransferase